MDAKLLEVLVCPVTKGTLYLQRQHNELWCKTSRLAYPIRDDVPVMLEAEARNLTETELQSLAST